MRRTVQFVALALGGVFAAACGDSGALSMATAPEASVVTCEDDPTQPGCEDPPPSPSIPPWLGPVVNGDYEAPNAPPTGATTGIWLGAAVTPATCFAHLSAAPIVDADQDYLSDSCELELAKGFAPTMKFDPADFECSNGEPWWAAKFFMNGLVRIAYLPAYYEDCGWPDGTGVFDHRGDNEYIMLEVEFDATKQRWVMKRIFLSAHFGSPDNGSLWVSPGDLQWRNKQLGNPIVWVAKWKHGNFKSKFSCDTYQDDCSSFPIILRFPVYPYRNVGSRTVPQGCVESTIRSPGSGRFECFWTPVDFRGWSPSNIGGSAGKYSDFLATSYYERRCGLAYVPGIDMGLPDCSALSDWGPDPSAPAYLITLSGPGYVYDGSFSVTATRSPGTPTGLHYEWQYIHCSSPDHAACQAYPWSTFTQGVNVMSVYDFIGRTDQFRDYRIRIRASAGGPVLYTTAIHRVYGGGEIEGCPPEDNFCVQLRAAPSTPATPVPQPKKRPAARTVRVFQ